MNKCCFCGAEIEDYASNDIRPLVTNNGGRCCDNCNLDIVIPNRIKFWSGYYFYAIKENDMFMFVDKIKTKKFEGKVLKYVTNSNQMLKALYADEFKARKELDKCEQRVSCCYTVVRVNLREDK